MCDFLDYPTFCIRYSLGKSSSVHELRFVSSNIVSARQKVLELHRNGELYPRSFSAFQDLKILSVVEC